MNPKLYKQNLLNELYKTYKNSMPCHLGYPHRKNIVFGEGDPDADIMFIGEAPGEEEDKQGRPFVGKSGQLLNKALELSGIKRNEIFITNVVKCRPPQNRNPLPNEIKLCTEQFLNKQIKIIRPKILVLVGSIALHTILDENLKITKVHGKKFKKDNYIVIPIYHPAYVLRNKSVSQTWLEDIKQIMSIYNKL